MKNFFIISMAAIAALSSCSSDNDTILGEDGNSNNNAETLLFTGVTEGDATTRTTLADGTWVNWSEDDQISVNGITFTTTPDGTDATKATFTKLTQADANPSAPYQACFPASMASGTGSSVAFSLPATYSYAAGKFNMPMYAQSDNTQLSFHNICGVLAIKVTSAEMSKVTKITVTSDKAISGPCTIALTDGKYAATANGTDPAYKTVTLDCGSAGVTPTADGTPFYLPVPVLADAAKLSIVVYGTLSDAKETEYQHLIYRQDMSNSGVTIARNKIYSVNFRTSLAQFTVKAAEGETPAKTVSFTSGNLYWDGSAFRFETCQNGYDHGTTSGETTTYTASHVSHFYWSKTASVMYAESYSDSEATTSDAFFFCQANKDNDANKVDGASGFYALSGGIDGEWTYLISGRTDASYLLKKGVSVTTSVGTATNCLIIAPDRYDYAAHPLQSTYTAAEWAAAEALGLVCLPASGYRSGSALQEAGTIGVCWSSSPYINNKDYAYGLTIYDGSTTPNDRSRNEGFAIRLVR